MEAGFGGLIAKLGGMLIIAGCVAWAFFGLLLALMCFVPAVALIWLGGAMATESRVGWAMITAIGAFALDAVLVFYAYNYPSSPSIVGPAHRGTGNASRTDADQIRQLVQTWTDAFNSRDLAAMNSLMCSGSSVNQNIFSPRDIRGAMSSEVTNINVSGDRATANIINSWSGSPNSHNAETDVYGKENGSWKICHTVNF